MASTACAAPHFDSKARAASRFALEPSVENVLHTPGQQLDPSARAVMEPRLGFDFGRVRIHADNEAAESARALSALAYTVGNDVVFGKGQYEPNSRKGQYLLAHELAHVAQQAPAEAVRNDIEFLPPDSSEERDAERVSRAAIAGKPNSRTQTQSGVVLARFSDTSHRVIEEAGLPRATADEPEAGFTAAQVGAIERGNMERDYSQLPGVVNLGLTGHAQTFGGYAATQHFDNFIFDAVTNRWRTRGAGQQKFLHLDPKEPDPTPIDYIAGQLSELARVDMSEESLVHLGNAFHTVEDFFAHSNFIELMQGDTRFGKELVTGSVPGTEAASLLHLVGTVSAPSTAGFYHSQAEASARQTEPLSHAQLAKDTAAAAGFTEARRLAALVIQDLSGDIIQIMRMTGASNAAKRRQLMEEQVVSKIRRYLRPPDPKDPWWQGLIARDNGAIDRRLAAAERRTPVTVNQAAFSPLRNLEASKDSPFALPVGVAARIGDQAFIQAGAGVTRPSPLDTRLPEPATPEDRRAAPFAGVQLTGRF